MLEPRFLPSDFGFRIASRYGLNFYVDGETLVEPGLAPGEREATAAEIAMWRRIVPPDEVEMLTNLWQKEEMPEIDATLEEVVSALRYKKIIYMNVKDFCAMRKLKSFTPNYGRKALLDGLLGTVKDGDDGTLVYVSREIPIGYYLTPDGVIDDLVWRPEEGGRVVAPELNEELKVELEMKMWMYRTNSFTLKGFDLEPRVDG